jgi:hypothetical protein
LVQIKPLGCSRKHGAKLLKELGELLVEGIRACLQVTGERRTQDRLIWQQPLVVRSIDRDGHPGEAIQCRGKDISLFGIGFYLPHALPTTQVCVDLPTNSLPPTVTVAASIVRVQRCGDGWYEVGALFLQPTLSEASTSDA